MRKSRVALLVFILSLAFTTSASANWMQGGHYTLDEFYEAIRGMEDIAPELVTVSEFGKSVEGRPLLVIKIAVPDGKKRAEALITGTTHANEWTGGRVALAIAERLAKGRGNDEWIDSLLSDMDFYVIPLMNPDGYLDADRHLDWGYTWRRDNANHVDLNRNWPYPREVETSASGAFLGGSNFKWHPNYSGPYPLSEPETQALDRFVSEHRFFTEIDFHTTGGHFSYAWSWKPEPAPDKHVFQAMGVEFRKRQPHHKYQVHQSFEWYQVIGSSKDWVYATYGVRALTIEVGIPKEYNRWKMGIRALNPFYRYNPLDVEHWIENDRDPTLYAIQKCYELTDGKPAEPVTEIEWVTGEMGEKEELNFIIVPKTPN